MQHVISPPLPGCPLSEVRKFLTSRGCKKVASLSDDAHEIWSSNNDFDHVRIPIKEDPVYYLNVIGIIEGQLGAKLYDVPFYAKQIAQRFADN